MFMALWLLHRIANTDLEALSDVVPEKLPAELDTLVMSCLDKNPEAHSQSVRELRERLESIPGITVWRREDPAR
jgi:hypothetical protein